jgi:hypothetical protein
VGRRKKSGPDTRRREGRADLTGYRGDVSPHGGYAFISRLIYLFIYLFIYYLFIYLFTSCNTASRASRDMKPGTLMNSGFARGYL